MHFSSHSGSLQAERGSTNQGCLAEHEVDVSSKYSDPLVFSVAGDPESEAAAHHQSLQRASAGNAEAASIEPKCQLRVQGCRRITPYQKSRSNPVCTCRRVEREEQQVKNRFEASRSSHHFDMLW